MGTPPVETVVSSVALHKDADVKKTGVDVTEEKLEEPPSPAVAQPRHTSPDLSFASEVTLHSGDLQYIRYRYKQLNLKQSL